MEALRRPVIRASIDGFHNPARVRHLRGSTSPEGYYYDSFDYQSLIECLLAPLGMGGSRQYRSAVFDYCTDSQGQVAPRIAEMSAVLLFDGVFLLRPELRGCWELTIFVDAPFDITLKRAQQRDLARFGDIGAVTQRYQERYIPGQRLYLAACRPRQRAELVVENSDPFRPALYEGKDYVSHDTPEPSQR